MKNRYVQDDDSQQEGLNPTLDVNGNELIGGDSVQLIKNLPLKGIKTILKIGSVFKKIRLTDDVELIECKDGKSVIVLRTEFVKKR